ncbi:MAG: FAD-dependent oxidoreductase [Nitrospirota bacterium]
MTRTVLIVGGGPAGLAAALRLSRSGYGVTLLERDGRLAGRLGLVPPVLLGCHTATLSLLDHLGLSRQELFPQQVPVEFLLPNGRTVKLRRPLAPPPLHTLVSVATFRGLSAADRWRFLSWMERTWEGDPPLPDDLESRTVDDWLAGIGQSAEARRWIWNPLVRFLVGGEATAVSAGLLVHTLIRWLGSGPQQARTAVPARELRSLLVGPIRDRLRQTGATIRLETRVDQVRFDEQRVSGVRVPGGAILTADWYILAVPHREVTPLLPERVLSRFAYFQQLTRLSDSPVVTVRLKRAKPLSAPRLVLLPGGTFHWLTAQHESVSVVAVGRADLLAKSDQELQGLAREEAVAALAGSAASGGDGLVVRMPQAHLLPHPGCASLRPLSQSPFPNLFLAGAWTDTGLPPALESALQSGELCAKTIMEKDGRAG